MADTNTPLAFRVADLHLAPSQLRRIESFESVEGDLCRAELETWHCTNSASVDLELAYVTPENGSREVRCIDRRGSPPSFDAIVDRLRLTLGSVDPTTDWVMLKLAKPKDGGVRPRFNLHGADWTLLQRAAGVDVRSTLFDLGAWDYLHAQRERAPAGPSVAFPFGDRRVPLAAYICTRVLPVLRG